MNKPVQMISNYKVVDYTTLRALNDTAIKMNFNRSWHWSEIRKVVKPNSIFPVQSLMLHPYRTTEAVRCKVVLTEKGETGTLDIPVELFNGLTDYKESGE